MWSISVAMRIPSYEPECHIADAHRYPKESRNRHSFESGEKAGGQKLQFDDPSLHANHGGVGSIVCAQLGKDGLDSALHGFLGDRELIRDLFVCVADCNQSQPGAPLYLSDPTAPGGRIVNNAAFTLPASGQGDLGRNALRGFNASQVDFTLQRLFKLSERFSLQASADFFNIFNHPQFGAPINYMTSPQFGQSTQTLNAWLGSGGQSGGLNPLYQIGGPRSIQLALKLQF